MNKLVLFDMDGTLTKGSILLDHAGFLIEKGYIQDDGSYEAWLLDRKNERLIANLARSYQMQISGMTIDDMHSEEFITSELADEDKWYSTLDILKKERDSGNNVWIISGSADYLVQELVKKLGIKGIGTKYFTDKKGRFNGKIEPMFTEGAKIKFGRTIYSPFDSNYHSVDAYGDTGSDAGLFYFGDYNVLVDPTVDTLDYYLTKRPEIRIDKIIRK